MWISVEWCRVDKASRPSLSTRSESVESVLSQATFGDSRCGFGVKQYLPPLSHLIRRHSFTAKISFSEGETNARAS
ncbi:Phytochrome B [Echinococcus multilocularis]|uniref:Phytochrome B n=1 Tax=Echinococcus multilocularis TaxID=6211 RepID=A0A0S4MKY6_ECHMU|nr:Phytochrome B [Echinococcus multilocularis]